jgi:acyl-CoA thioesterase FadM
MTQGTLAVTSSIECGMHESRARETGTNLRREVTSMESFGSVAGGRSQVSARPRYEGANIRSWIGFKHFMYLAEESVLQWFRERGLGPQFLYEQSGHGLEVIESSVFLPAVLELDDEVVADASWLGDGRFAVAFSVQRGDRTVTVLKGKLTVALIREIDAPGNQPLAESVAALAAPDVAAVAAQRTQIAAQAHAHNLETSAHRWSWRARYFYCHYSDRVQHSAYIRALEEVVARFLESRGLAVGELLKSRGWIPVVSRASVRLLSDAHMEEVVHTTFSVEEVLKRAAFVGRMQCYVARPAGLVHTATARIVHGYALSRGPKAGNLAEFDDATVAALTGGIA